MSDKDELAAELRAMKAQMTPSPQLVSQVMTSLSEEGAGSAPDLCSGTSPAGRLPNRAADPRASVSPTTPRRHRGPGRNHRLAGMLSGGVLAAVLAVVMIGGGLPSLFTGATPASWPTTTGWTPRPGSLGSASGPGGTVVATPVNPQAYEDVFQVLSAMSPMGYGATYSTGITGMPASMPASGNLWDLAGSTVSFDSLGYVGTNTQVATIDEGDFVKTDGENIYVAHGRTVTVVSAAAGQSRQIATIDTSKLASGDDLLTGPVADLMIEGQTLIVLAHGFSANLDGWGGNQGTWLSLQATSLKTAFYDIADPASPRLLSVLSQSGSLVDSRLSDGMLYLVSQYMVDTANADPNDPATIVPLTGTPATPVPVSDVFIMPTVDSPTYSLVTAIDVAGRRMTGEQAVLGRADTVYMSPDNLYLACTQWIGDLPGVLRSEVTVPGGAGAYTGAITDIVRIGLAGGKPVVAATATVAGNIVNQFALDEYDGHLRLVTTWNDTTNSKWQQNAALWVLDSSLSAVSSIPELARDEGVQSVRFDGATAYVVTYRQVDPLFAIDLSDPAHPVVMSALKIPGFSTYLHVFGDGLLLGVGMGDGGVGLKISMFDVSNPYDVREFSTLPIDADSTDVSYDHHAAFVDVPNSLVGFPTTKWTYDPKVIEASGGKEQPAVNWDYRLFSWTGTEFEPQTTINLMTAAEAAPRQFGTDQSVRGVRVADSLYLVTSGFLSVYDLNTHTPQTVVTYK